MATDDEIRQATKAFTDSLKHTVLTHLGPRLAFLARCNQRAAMVSFGSSEQQWLVVMVTKELVDQLGDVMTAMQETLRTAAAKAGVEALDEAGGAHTEREADRKRQPPKDVN